MAGTSPEWNRRFGCFRGNGKEPLASIQQLWEDKTGKTPVQENSNEYTYWGNVMEGIIRKEFMNRTGLKYGRNIS